MYINISEIMRLKGRLSDVKTSLKDTLNGVTDELINVNNNIKSNELVSSNKNIRTKIEDLTSNLNTNLDTLFNFLSEQIDNYQGTNEKAKESLESLVTLINSTFDENGNVIKGSVATVATTVYDDVPVGNPQGGVIQPSPIPIQETGAVETSSPVSSSIVATESSFTLSQPDAGFETNTDIYTNKPECGFVVTTDNQTYSLSDGDRDLIYSIVAAESDKSYDDSLAVASVILNRCEAPNWVASYGSNPVSQATAKNQFVVYQQGYYRQYIGGNAPDTVKRAVDDALNGVRNCDYLSFRSNGTTSYSNNQITSSGNRYK